MKKIKVLLIIISLSLLLIYLYSCKREPDPFVDETTIDTDIVDETTIDTDNRFSYGLSAEDAYNKYGMLSFIYAVNMDNSYDGEYIYGTTLFKTKKGSTLCRYEYPDITKMTPACTDPLCTHGIESECPFKGANAFCVACYEDKIYFAADDHGVYVYDKKSNKSIKVWSGCLDVKFFKYDDNLYLSYTTEDEEDVADEEFISYREFFVISPGGKIAELGKIQISELFSEAGIIFKNKYYIDYNAEIKNNKVEFSVLKHDLTNGEISVTAKLDCSRDAISFDNSLTYMIYNDKLLVRVSYIKNAENREKLIDIWLVNLTSGESRLICMPDKTIYGTSNAWCLYSQKCLVWHDPRFTEEEPLSLHVLFPRTGEEKTYDLSKIVFNVTGDIIPLDASISTMVYSSVQLRKTINDKTYVIYEIDLENGKVNKVLPEL